MKPKDTKGPRKLAAKSVKPLPAAAAVAPKTKAVAAPAKAKRISRVPRFKIPAILLEGDAPPTPTAGGPGHRYALGPTSAPGLPLPPSAELPESYGTQQLFLAARDPHWLYAHWDFSREQLKKYNTLSVDGHLALRVYRGAAEGNPLTEIHLHPESRTWFIPVPAAGAKYVAELGYHDAARKWVSLARSGATFTPPDSLSDDTSIRFATIPPEVPFAALLAMVKGAVREHVPLVEAMQQMRAQGFRDLPTPEEVKREWTPAQEKALAEVISMDNVRRIWIGSLEITELIRRQLQPQVSSIGAAQFGLPSSARGAVSSLSSVSSPFGGAERHRGFWFNVNAELIIYGATEPDAKVTIGDRPIKLRPDGVETRSAHLKFSRETTYRGDVGTHPQDKKLKPPVVTSVA